MSRRATVADDYDVLALERDALVPLRAVKDGSLEIVDVEGWHVGSGESADGRDEDVAGPNPLKTRLDVPAREEKAVSTLKRMIYD